jgi:hypothetical protein
MRILVQTLYTLLHGDQGLQDQMKRLQLLSLFEEASAWLQSFPHHVLDVRNEMRLVSSTPQTSSKIVPAVERKKNASPPDHDPWNDSWRILEHMRASPWMPSFVFLSARAANAQGSGSYGRVMGILRDDNEWSVDLQLPHMLPVKGDVRDGEIAVKLEDRSFAIKHVLREAGVVSIPTFLSPRKQSGNDRRWAQLILTLGYFTYWSHLADHHCFRSARELAEIIGLKTGRPYQGLDDLDAAAKQIDDDIEALQSHVEMKIRRDKHNEWWRFLDRCSRFDIIGSTRPKNHYAYWLNGSIRFSKGHD